MRPAPGASVLVGSIVDGAVGVVAYGRVRRHVAERHQGRTSMSIAYEGQRIGCGLRWRSQHGGR